MQRCQFTPARWSPRANRPDLICAGSQRDPPSGSSPRIPVAPVRRQSALARLAQTGGLVSTAGMHPDASESAVAFFDASATDYLAQANSKPDFLERFGLFQEQIAMAKHKSGGTPLCVDLGCGPGTLSAVALQHGFSVIGIDGSGAMLDRARSLTNAQRPAIQYRLSPLPLPTSQMQDLEASVDLVVASSVIEYLADDHVFIEQCHRLLAPGGTALVSFANKHSLYRAAARQVSRLAHRPASYLTVQQRQHDESTARLLCQRAGFAVESVYYFGLPTPLYRVPHPNKRPVWLATLFLLVLRRSDSPTEVFGDATEDTR